MNVVGFLPVVIFTSVENGDSGLEFSKSLVDVEERSSVLSSSILDWSFPLQS